MVKVVPVVCCGSCCALLIFGVIAIPMSLKSLEQGKFALKLDWTTQLIDEEVVTNPGMYFVGLGNMLIEYPSTFQNMYFVDDTRVGSGSEEDIMRSALRARSKDGLELRLSVSFQWKLEPNALKPLYKILGGGEKEVALYRDEFVRFARAALVNATCKFPADMYFYNRLNITAHMLDLLTDVFNKPEKGLLVSIKGLQLREVTFPAEFDAEIRKTLKQSQEVEIATAERQEQIVAMERDLSVMKQTVLEAVQKANGTARAIIEVNDAEVRQSLILEEKNAVANAKILETMDDSAGTDPYKRLFEIMQVRAVDDHASETLVMDM